MRRTSTYFYFASTLTKKLLRKTPVLKSLGSPGSQALPGSVQDSDKQLGEAECVYVLLTLELRAAASTLPIPNPCGAASPNLLTARGLFPEQNLTPTLPAPCQPALTWLPSSSKATIHRAQGQDTSGGCGRCWSCRRAVGEGGRRGEIHRPATRHRPPPPRLAAPLPAADVTLALHRNTKM